MLILGPSLVALGLLGISWTTNAYQNSSATALLQSDLSRLEDRPPGCPKCPSCFNCNTESDHCTQFAACNKPYGKCSCPPGFGGDDCSEPLCDSLADGNERVPRGTDQKSCTCKAGWEGINCNVCKTDQACSALMPEKHGGVCYKHSAVVKENYQMCDVTNEQILKQLGEQKPQVTFSCNAGDETCNFQCKPSVITLKDDTRLIGIVWVDEVESFYCALNTCTWTTENEVDKNTTVYQCDQISCSCIPNRMLCGKDGALDLSEFLQKEIKGPAKFASESIKGGEGLDHSKFDEPAMNNLIKQVFGDPTITLECSSGECLYRTEVPGYARPVPRINTPLIAGVIAGCALFVVVTVLLVWYLSRRQYSRHGPIYLDDSDDESAKMMADHKSAALEFENVSYHLNGKQILSGVQGIAQPGQLMAIMGASGAGKTTFLDILARKNKRGVVEGQFYVNGEKVVDSEYRSVVGFVDQDDTMLPTLTVHETILMSALLRLPRDMGISVKEQRVFEVEKQLGIFHIRDQLIGSEEGNGRGISGGEKRRVGIACELVTSPSILFLDEPTSGLDAFNAFNVVECLVNLAKNYNRTVVFTIHQPRSNIVALFDQLILLAKGRLVYSGPFAGCQHYFDSIGYSCPPGFNIADYLVDLTMHAGVERTPGEEREIPVLDADLDPSRTVSSSVRAVKSIASTSNISIENNSFGSQNEFLKRPKGTRRRSLKQQQDRKLYTRKVSGGVETPETSRTTDDEVLGDNALEASQQWLKLSRSPGTVPPQILDDPHQLPPPPTGLGTDLDLLISSFASSDVKRSTHENIQAAVQNGINANGPANGQSNDAAKTGMMKSYKRIGILRQFAILSRRTWRNLYRNPMLMLAHYAIAILVAVMCGFLFYGLTDDIKGFQDRLGLLFFILALFGFSTLTSLTVFSSERLLFVRERANGYYAPVTYFAAKVIFDIVPLRLIPPIILGSIVYPMTGLVAAWPEFLKFMLVLILFNLAAAMICLLIGIIFKDGGVANLIGSLVMLFSLLFAGFLLNHDAIPPAALWLQKVSDSTRPRQFNLQLLTFCSYLSFITDSRG